MIPCSSSAWGMSILVWGSTLQPFPTSRRRHESMPNTRRCTSIWPEPTRRPTSSTWSARPSSVAGAQPCAAAMPTSSRSSRTSESFYSTTESGSITRMPRAVLNLQDAADLRAVQGQWRFAPGFIPGQPNEGLIAQAEGSPARLPDYDDSGREVCHDLTRGRSRGFTFAWYRINVTLPETIHG